MGQSALRSRIVVASAAALACGACLVSLEGLTGGNGGAGGDAGMQPGDETTATDLDANGTLADAGGDSGDGRVACAAGGALGDNYNCGICGRACAGNSCAGNRCSVELVYDGVDGGGALAVASNGTNVYFSTPGQIRRQPLPLGTTPTVTTEYMSAEAVDLLLAPDALYDAWGPWMMRRDLSSLGASYYGYLNGQRSTTTLARRVTPATIYCGQTNTGGTGLLVIDSSGNGSLYANNADVTYTWGVAFREPYLFWTQANSGVVRRSNVNVMPTAYDTMTTLVTSPRGIAVDNDYVYVVSQTGPNASDPGSVLRFAQSSWRGDAGAPTLLAGGQSMPEHLVENGDYVYWLNRGVSFSDGAILRAKKDGSEPPLLLAGGIAQPTRIAVDGTHIYWASANGVHRTTR